MDVIRPPLLWIDGCCYRQNVMTQEKNKCENYEKADKIRDFSEYEDDVCEIDESVITSIGDQFVTNVDVPSELCAVIVGKQGATKKRLEYETRTKITVPPRDKEAETKIVGRCKGDVLSARNRIEILVLTARQKHRPTHFISIPLLSSEIKDRFTEFKTQVLQTCNKKRGFTPALFQEAEKLHLTVGTLVLLSENDRRKAAQVLNDCGNKYIHSVLENKSLVIEMSGIEYMNDDPSEVNVLYGKVSFKSGPAGALQRLADNIVDEYVKEGLMSKRYESVKLHATLMNSSFARDQQTHGDPEGSTTNRSFDATKIIELYKDFRFGECAVPAIHLSQLHSKGADGYYKCSAKVYTK